MRRDAARNRETILSSAIGVLAGAPHASMREVAEASGIGRTTLYRHFPDRRALLDAVYARVYAEAEEISEARLDSPDADGDAVEVLAHLATALAALGDRYRFLEEAPESRAADADSARREARFTGFIARAQDAGAVRCDVSPDWLLGVFVALVTLAAERRAAPHDAGHAYLAATVRSVLAPAAPTR